MPPADCQTDTYNDGIDECSPCSTICDNAKARGTLTECQKELSCAAYYERMFTATTTMTSNIPDSTRLPQWVAIPIAIGVIFVIGACIYVAIRRWRRREEDRNVRYTVQATDEHLEILTDSGVSTGGSKLSNGSSSGTVPVSPPSTPVESGTNATGISEMGEQKRYMVAISDAQD